jgi:hypothetical protein
MDPNNAKTSGMLSDEDWVDGLSSLFPTEQEMQVQEQQGDEFSYSFGHQCDVANTNTSPLALPDLMPSAQMNECFFVQQQCAETRSPAPLPDVMTSAQISPSSSSTDQEIESAKNTQCDEEVQERRSNPQISIAAVPLLESTTVSSFYTVSTGNGDSLHPPLALPKKESKCNKRARVMTDSSASVVSASSDTELDRKR